MELETSFIADVIDILSRARENAYTAINTEMVAAYWSIGQRIIEEEQKGQKRADYGAFLLKALSKKLAGDLGTGVSLANLKNFRQFYITFPEGKRTYARNGHLSWTHYRLIMRLEDVTARNWYLKECAGQNWTGRQLERNIHTKFYERLLSSDKKSDILLKEESLDKHSTSDFIRDPYVFEFLNVPQPLLAKEGEIEQTLLTHLQHFLLELGKGFSFVGRQYRITTETSHFYLDLVFYNYLLKCFVLFDLKATKLSHQDVGQMDMYVRMFDDLRRGPDDNPTIGVILCADKDETVVKYSVLNGNDQLFASKYRTVLPTEKELIAEIEKDKYLMTTLKEKDNHD